MGGLWKTPTIGCATPTILISLITSTKKTHMLKLSWLIPSNYSTLYFLRSQPECHPRFPLPLNVGDPGG
ncbi:hypothetical protein CsSME_00043425 [Camellia sinensis var. sinensis]